MADSFYPSYLDQSRLVHALVPCSPREQANREPLGLVGCDWRLWFDAFPGFRRHRGCGDDFNLLVSPAWSSKRKTERVPPDQITIDGCFDPSRHFRRRSCAMHGPPAIQPAASSE